MADTNRINSHFYQIAVADADDNVWGIKADVANVNIYGGTTGQVLTTDGAGNLYWGVGGGGGTQQPLIEWTAASGSGQTFSDANVATFLDGTYASVYVNGVLLASSEYNISGTTLTVTSWLNTGDLVTVGATGAGGGGSGSGTVTSVATTQVDPSSLGFTLDGGPITTSGTVTLNVPTAAALTTALGLGNTANYPALNGNSSTYLDGTGNWVAVSGGGGGTVTSVGGVGNGLGFSLSGTVTSSGNITLTTPTDAQLRTSLSIGNIATINLNGNGNTYLNGNGTWSAISAVPGGTTGMVQFNNGGTFTGAVGLTYSLATLQTTIANVALQDFQETIQLTGNTGTSLVPDFNLATIFRYTANSNFSFNGFTNAVAGKSATVIITQDATGGRTMTSTMKWAGGFKTLSTAPNAVDIVCVFFDGSNYYASLTTGYV